MKEKNHDCLYCANESFKTNSTGKQISYCNHYQNWINFRDHDPAPKRNMGFCPGFEVETTMSDRWDQVKSVITQPPAAFSFKSSTDKVPLKEEKNESETREEYKFSAQNSFIPPDPKDYTDSDDYNMDYDEWKKYYDD